MRLTHRLAALTLAAAPITTLGIAAPAAFAAPAAPATASHTLWLGPQPVTVTAGINAYITGQPHVCIRNNGPHPIRLVTDHVTDTASHTRLRGGGGAAPIRAGRSYCWTSWVSLRPAWAVVHVSAVDQADGRYGAAAFRLTR